MCMYNIRFILDYTLQFLPFDYNTITHTHTLLHSSYCCLQLEPIVTKPNNFMLVMCNEVCITATSI